MRGQKKKIILNFEYFVLSVMQNTVKKLNLLKTKGLVHNYFKKQFFKNIF